MEGIGKKSTKDKRRLSPEENRAMKLQHRYGISVEEYDKMFNEQGGICKICGKEETYKRLSVDHCHTTGLIRGLLCTKCNRGIGFFGDSLSLLHKAINYLRRESV